MSERHFHRTNIELDEELVREAMQIFRCRTKKELVNLALEELVRREKLTGILDMDGRVDWHGAATDGSPSA